MNFENEELKRLVKINENDEDALKKLTLKNNKMYEYLPSYLKKDYQFNIDLINKDNRFVYFIEDKLIFDMNFLIELSRNGVDVSEFVEEYYIKKEEKINKKIEFLEIGKKFIEQYFIDETLTKEKFCKNNNITIKSFDASINYINKIDEELYKDIRKILLHNSEMFLEEKQEKIELFIDCIDKDIVLPSGDIREFNLVDYEYLLGDFGIAFGFNGLKKHYNKIIENEKEKKLRDFYNDNRELTLLRINSEFKTKILFKKNSEIFEVGNQDKEFVYSLMKENKLGEFQKTYKLLLKSHVFGKLDDEYYYLKK